MLIFIVMTVVGNFYFSIFLRLTWEFLGLESERGGSVCWPNNKIIESVWWCVQVESGTDPAEIRSRLREALPRAPQKQLVCAAQTSLIEMLPKFPSPLSTSSIILTKEHQQKHNVFLDFRSLLSLAFRIQHSCVVHSYCRMMALNMAFCTFQ